MPVEQARLSAMQEKFAQLYAMTRNSTYAAERAGYSVKTAQVAGSKLRANPAVAGRIQQIMREKFERYAADVPDVLASIMYNEANKASDRVKAAKLIADGVGYAPPKALDQLEPHEMTPDQLAQARAAHQLQIDALELVAADRARPIDDVAIVEDVPVDAGVFG